MIQNFIPLVAAYISNMGAIILPALGIGILCGIPYVIRRIIDYV